MGCSTTWEGAAEEGSDGWIHKEEEDEEEEEEACPIRHGYRQRAWRGRRETSVGEERNTPFFFIDRLTN